GVRKITRHSGPRAMGVDVSEYQGTIDWNTVAHSGISFAIARVSDGLGHPDPTFARNWSEMRKQGTVRRVYQFFRPTQDAVQQAALLLSKIGGKLLPGDLPIVCDIEVKDGVSGAHMTSQLAKWGTRIHQKTGIRPAFYTSPGFWNGYITGPFGLETLWV